MKKVTVIGGGTGTFVVLSGIKKQKIDLSAIVAMSDSGGSTGRLRDQLGVLPPGDLRQCLVALSEAPVLWRKLFLYRFSGGDLKGHNFGNIFLSALEKVTGSYNDVIKIASYVLDVKGEVIPSTFKETNLCVKYENGKELCGEGKIDTNYQEESKIKEAYLTPQVTANPRALSRIQESDFLVFGPGDLYVSTIAPLLSTGVKETISKSNAKIIYIMNLMTRSGQTPKYGAWSHIKDLSEYTGRVPDVVVINNGTISHEIIESYEKEGEAAVKNDLFLSGYKGKLIEGDIVDNKKFKKEESDTLVDPKVRSILRHDSVKLARILNKIFS